MREQQRKIEIAGADYARAGREIEAIDAETESTRAEIEHLITEADRCNAGNTGHNGGDRRGGFPHRGA